MSGAFWASAIFLQLLLALKKGQSFLLRDAVSIFIMICAFQTQKSHDSGKIMIVCPQQLLKGSPRNSWAITIIIHCGLLWVLKIGHGKDGAPNVPCSQQKGRFGQTFHEVINVSKADYFT